MIEPTLSHILVHLVEEPLPPAHGELGEQGLRRHTRIDQCHHTTIVFRHCLLVITVYFTIGSEYTHAYVHMIIL